MIYKKHANFPHPVLSTLTMDYPDSNFRLNVSVSEVDSDYQFELNYQLDSNFLIDLLDNDKATMFVVVQSQDNKFYELKNSLKIIIPKTEISLHKRTELQLFIMTKTRISMNNNQDLDDFYHNEKNKIFVSPYNVLAISNIERFDGDIKKPFNLFEKDVSPDLESEIKVELGPETIIIHYKDEKYQFNGFSNHTWLNNPYVYIGLERALLEFIENNGENGEVDLREIEVPVNKLDWKLYDLMKRKDILRISRDTIDEVIYKITDKIIDKYYKSVERLNLNAN